MPEAQTTGAEPAADPAPAAEPQADAQPETLDAPQGEPLEGLDDALDAAMQGIEGDPAPADGGDAQPPADGGDAQPPADGGDAQPPADGGDAQPPADAMAQLQQEFPEHFPQGQNPEDVQRNLHLAARYARQNPGGYIQRLAQDLGVDLGALTEPQGGQQPQQQQQAPEDPEPPERNPLDPDELDTPFESAVKQQLRDISAVRQDVQTLTQAQQHQAQQAVESHIKGFMAQRDDQGNLIRPHFENKTVQAKMNQIAAGDPVFREGRATDDDLHRIYTEATWSAAAHDASIRESLVSDLRGASAAQPQQPAPQQPAPQQPAPQQQRQQRQQQVDRVGGGFTQGAPNTEHVNGLDIPRDLDTEDGEDIDYVLDRLLPA